jgi:hypothetical protein
VKRAAHIGRKRLKKPKSTLLFPEISSFTRKTEEACFSDVGTYYNPEDINFNIHGCKSLKFHIILIVKNSIFCDITPWRNFLPQFSYSSVI